MIILVGELGWGKSTLDSENVIIGRLGSGKATHEENKPIDYIRKGQ